MTSRRLLKAAEAIRQVVSMTILTDLRDPRIENVTVTRVEVSPDMREAKVHVSVMGDESRQQLALRGLRSAAGYLQQKVGNRIETRYTPRLRFELDKGVQHSIEVSRLLNELLPKEDPAAAESPSPAGDPGPTETQSDSSRSESSPADADRDSDADVDGDEDEADSDTPAS